MFRGIANCKVGNGSTVLFWSDVWNSHLLQNIFPRLYSFAKNKTISVMLFLQNNSLEQQFHLPLSGQAYQEFQEMQELIELTLVLPEAKDTWSYIWGNSTYTASKFYHFPYKNFQPPRPFIWIWESKCCNKLKVFVWLLLMDRLNVRNILRRKNYRIQGNNYNCVLCSRNVEESTFHLFFTCEFTKKCWDYLQIHWDTEVGFFTMMEKARQQYTPGFFMEIFILGAWETWKQRNDHIFNRRIPSFSNWKRGFVKEAQLQALRLQPRKQESFLSLIQMYS
jgi:hypothetical protein